jgi:SAM-dependent methyltransferase
VEYLDPEIYQKSTFDELVSRNDPILVKAIEFFQKLHAYHRLMDVESLDEMNRLDGNFDLIIIGNLVMTHLSDPLAVNQEMYKHLRPGGKLFTEVVGFRLKPERFLGVSSLDFLLEEIEKNIGADALVRIDTAMRTKNSTSLMITKTDKPELKLPFMLGPDQLVKGMRTYIYQDESAHPFVNLIFEKGFEEAFRFEERRTENPNPFQSYLKEFSQKDQETLLAYFLNLKEGQRRYVIADRYEFENLIGIGEQGVLFKFKDLKKGGNVVLKVFFKDSYDALYNQQAIMNRLEDIGRQGQLHPSIRKVFSAGKIRGRDKKSRLYVLLEYVPMQEIIHMFSANFGNYAYSAKAYFEASLQILSALEDLIKHGMLLFDPQIALTGSDKELKAVLFDLDAVSMIGGLDGLDPAQMEDVIRRNPFSVFQEQWMEMFMILMELMARQNETAMQFSDETLDTLLHRLDEISSHWTMLEKILFQPIVHIMKTSLYYLKGDLESAYVELQNFEKFPAYQEKFYDHLPLLGKMREEILNKGRISRMEVFPAVLEVKMEDLVGGERNLEYLERIKEIVNPNAGEGKKIALYVGAGADISTALFSTDAEEYIFVDRLAFDRPSMNEKEKSRLIEEYVKSKKQNGYGIISVLEKIAMRSFLEAELGFLGAQDLKINRDKSDPKIFVISFKWQGKERRITYISRTTASDITSYEQYLRRLGGVDFYILKSGQFAEFNASLTKKIASRFLNPGGFLIMDRWYNADSKEAFTLDYVEKMDDSILKEVESFGASFGYAVSQETKGADIFKKLNMPGLSEKITKDILLRLGKTNLSKPAEVIGKVGELLKERYPELSEPYRDDLREDVIFKVLDQLSDFQTGLPIFSSHLKQKLITMLAEKRISKDVIEILEKVSGTAVFFAVMDQLARDLHLFEDPSIQEELLEFYTRTYLKTYLKENHVRNIQNKINDNFQKKFSEDFGKVFSVTEVLVEYVKAKFFDTDLERFNEDLSIVLEEPFMSEDLEEVFVGDVLRSGSRLHFLTIALRNKFQGKDLETEIALENKLIKLLSPMVRKEQTRSSARQRVLDVAA